MAIFFPIFEWLTLSCLSQNSEHSICSLNMIFIFIFIFYEFSCEDKLINTLNTQCAGISVRISAIDLVSVAVVAKFNTFEGAELQLLQATCPPSLKQRRLLIFSRFQSLI